MRPTTRMGRMVKRVVARLADGQERPAGGCLPDAELTALDVALSVETDVQAEHRLLQVGLADLGAHLGTRGLAVLARTVDRAADDLRRDIARRAEELRIAAVRLLEGLHDRMGAARRERRGVDAAERRERVVEEAVGAHQDDAALTRGPHLVAERLALRRQLPRDVHELRVARDLRDQRREVRLLLADAVTRDGDAGRPELL